MKKYFPSLLLIYFVFLIISPIFIFSKLVVNIYDFILFGILIFLVIYILKIKKLKKINLFPINSFLFLLVSFTLLYLFKLFESDYSVNIRDLIAIWSPLKYLFLIVILYYFFTKNIINKLLSINIFFMLILGIMAIFQLFDIFEMKRFIFQYYSSNSLENKSEYLYWNPRATTVFNLEPNLFGMYMSMSLIILIIMYDFIKINKVFKILAFIFGIIGMILSGSFTAILTFVIALFIYLIFYKKIGIKSFLFSFIIVFILIYNFSFQLEILLKRQKIDENNLIPSSLKYRFEYRWKKVINDFEKSPIIGIGPATETLDYSTDNDYLDKFLRYGIIGGIIFVLFMISLIIYPLIIRKNVDEIFLRRLLFLSFLLSLMFSLSFITGSFFKGKRLAEFFWIFYSLGIIYYLKERK